MMMYLDCKQLAFCGHALDGISNQANTIPKQTPSTNTPAEHG
jgi:hypothetical protein